MRAWRAETRAFIVASALMLSPQLIGAPAEASNAHQRGAHPLAQRVSLSGASYLHADGQGTAASEPDGADTEKRAATRSFGISCVPYARAASGIRVLGNAWQWWGNASGRYARGDRPEAGSVLTFRSNSRMRLGHVAVVRTLVNPREVIVDHANWPSNALRGAVSRNIAVVDVSEPNNWSAVRVQLPTKGEFGSVYPTYGFIYNRPDTGVVAATIDRPAPQPPINKVPSDLRPVAERPWHTIVKVADAPDGQP